MHPDRPVQTTLAFHLSRIVVDVGVLLAMLAMSLPFVSSPAGSRSALAADAFPAVVLLLPIFLITLIPDHTRPIHPILGWVSIVLALAALPYAFVKFLDARVLADTLGGSVGIGPLVLLLGCVVTIAGLSIAIVRDLLGKPSGGTPQRSAAYATKRQPGTRPQARLVPPPDETRLIEPTIQTSRPALHPNPEALPSDETETRVIPRVAPRPADPVVPRQPAQAEIMFPDTGAVAREAEPEQQEDPALTTAERADAALTDHLLTMFDRGEIGDEPEEH